MVSVSVLQSAYINPRLSFVILQRLISFLFCAGFYGISIQVLDKYIGSRKNKGAHHIKCAEANRPPHHLMNAFVLLTVQKLYLIVKAGGRPISSTPTTAANLSTMPSCFGAKKRISNWPETATTATTAKERTGLSCPFPGRPPFIRMNAAPLFRFPHIRCAFSCWFFLGKYSFSVVFSSRFSFFIFHGFKPLYLFMRYPRQFLHVGAGKLILPAQSLKIAIPHALRFLLSMPARATPVVDYVPGLRDYIVIIFRIRLFHAPFQQAAQICDDRRKQSGEVVEEGDVHRSQKPALCLLKVAFQKK
jgi:hypothetical protein